MMSFPDASERETGGLSFILENILVSLKNINKADLINLKSNWKI